VSRPGITYNEAKLKITQPKGKEGLRGHDEAGDEKENKRSYAEVLMDET